MNVAAVSAGDQDASVNKALELVRHRLRGHSDCLGEVGHTKLSGPNQRMQKSEARVVCEHLEERLKVLGLGTGEEGTTLERRFRRTDDGALSGGETAGRSIGHAATLHRVMV